jgi:hypothetical protein
MRKDEEKSSPFEIDEIELKPKDSNPIKIVNENLDEESKGS